MAEAGVPQQPPSSAHSLQRQQQQQQRSSGSTLSSHPPATTTISTIAVQSGATRIVVALLQSKEWLELQVLEMSPDMTRMGDCFVTSSDLLMAHQDVLKKLQSKQSPVEELLKQADQLIASQRPRAEVYAAMAESLGQAWKDLNSFLEQRRVILEYNVAFHSHAEDVIDKLASLDRESAATSTLPSDVDSIKRLRTRIEESRKSALESLRLALQDGEVLLEKLTALKNLGTLDSRPGHILTAVNAALNQVRRWLEALHDRRRRSETAFQQRRAALDQWSEVCSLRRDLAATEKRLEALGRNGSTALGDSSATAEMLLFEHNKITPECKELQEKTLKLTHRAEELQGRWRNELGGANGAEQVRNEAYALLDKTSEFLETVEQREQLLAQSIHFFRVAATALTKLDQLEVQLTAHQVPPGSPQLAQLHAQVSRALEDATAPALHHGYSLLDIVGRSHPGAEGIRKTVELIENRGIQLGSLCTAHKEESLRISQAVRNFIEQYDSLQSWLLDVIEGFLRTHTDMRGTLPEARDVLDLHIQLYNDLNMRGSEIESLLRSVNPLCEMAEEAQAHEVQMKGDVLHDTWKRLGRAMADRVELMQAYVRLHGLAMAVQEAWDDVETRCQQLDVDEEPSAAIRQVEEIWLDGQQKYLQLSQLGRNFMADALKISDRYLDVRKACLCVESLLEYLGGRQLTVHRVQETWIETVTTIQHTRHEWNHFVSIIQSVMEIHEEKEQSLYPMLPRPAVHQPTCSAMVELLDESCKRVVAEWSTTIDQLESKKLEAEQVPLPPAGGNQEDRSKMLGDVSLLQQRMQFRLKEYKTLVQMGLALFRNLAEVESMVEMIDRKQIVYKTTAEVDQAVKDHQVTVNTVNELIKITRQEADQLIRLLQDQEPPGITQSDVHLIESYLKRTEEYWEKSWNAQENRLARQRQRCQFNSDLHTINAQLDDLSNQLAAMRGQYGSSLAAAKVTSQAFFQFEKTIELLEVRIGTFSSTAKKIIDEEEEKEDRASLELEVSQMNRKWSSFHREVGETRQLIDLSIDYFTLVEEVEQSFRTGSQVLVTVARKSTQVKTPEEAQTLLREVDGFIKPQEAQLEHKITKISQLAIQLYGQESSNRIQPVLQENRSMLDSFSVMNSELATLAINLKAAEDDRFKQAETQAAVQESLDAARAEAASARAAASAAEEARKAAEAAALAMKETAAVPPRPPLPASIPELPRPSAAALAAGRAPTPPKRSKQTDSPVEGPAFTTLLENATVEESKSVQLSCRVTGQPIPSISWLKDGMAITNNPDYQTTFDERDGTCCLTIEETFADDSARFTCQASNLAGFAQTTAVLRVQECPEDVLLPPEFVEPLMDSTAREGQPHQLSCRVVGVPAPLISWYKNGVCVDHSRDYIITYDDGLCQLGFSQVFVEDGAIFECRAANEAGDADTAATLIVEPLEPTEIPAFKPGLSSNVMARTGQKVRLECVLSAGLPKPTILWLHNHKPVKETRDIKTLVEGNKHLLTITEAFPKDAGTYTVVARNVAGEATTTCNLAVKGRVPTETSDSELASDMEPIKPGIQQSLPARMTVNEGDKVRMDCVIVAQPEPEVIWYHKDRPVKESSDFQLIFQGDRCSLIIREAFQEDSGLYRVVAVNSAGEASSQCQLVVSPMEEKRTDGRESAVALVSLTAQPDPTTTEPPVFKKVFGNATVEEGGPLVFDCTITGRPTPQVQWHFNDQLIRPSSFGPKETQIGENQYRLSIGMARPEHAGRYKCVAESESGVATCIADATVQPRKQDDSFVSRRAVFSQSSTVVSSQESSYRSVTRQVQQSITQVSGQMAQQTATERTEVVEKAEGDDEPVLSVKQRASLFAGQVDQAVAKAGPIQQPAKKTQRKDVGPRFVTALTGVMVEPGANIQLEGILDGHPVPDVKWYKNGVEIVPSDDQDRLDISSGGQKVRLSIQQMEESDAGRYTCTARNSAGTASSTADVVVRRTQFPPVFGRRLQAQTVRPGSRITMEVEVTGTPPPEVSWSRDDRLLTSSDDGRVSTKVEGTRHWIVIAKVTELDAGRYTVRALNRAGEAISTAELFVSPPAVVQVEDPPASRKHPPLKVDVSVKPADLLPEPPPEVLYAPKSETPKSGSFSGTRVDFAEKTRLLEEASKIVSPTEVPGRIRLLPMPSSDSESPPRNIRPTPPPELPPRQPSLELSKFEPFPELEPFPFKPDPPRPEKKKPSGVPTVRKPGKFVRGESRESDYESDLEGARITPRWVPPGSDTDTDTASYKKVKPKLASEGERTSRAVSKEPTPPTEFEIPPEMEGPPRPKVLPLDPEFIASVGKAEEIQPVVIPFLAAQQTLPSRVKSPKPPSAEGLAMEKAWVPKRVETDSPSKQLLPKLSSSPVGAGHVKPSPKALEMEKQWSHRFTSHNSKIWPPPPPDNEPPSIPIWNAGQSSSFSLSSSVMETTTTTTTQQLVETVSKKSILKSSTGPAAAGPERHVKIQGDGNDEVAVDVAKAVPAVISSSEPALKLEPAQASSRSSSAKEVGSRDY